MTQWFRGLQKWQNLPVVGFVLLCAGVTAAGLWFSMWTTTLQINSLANADALRWASLVRDELPEAADLARGTVLTPTLRGNIQKLSAAGAIRAIRIYDQGGHIVIQAGPFDGVIETPYLRQSFTTTAGNTDIPPISVRPALSDMNHSLTVGMPLIAADQAIGRLEVDVDGTANHDASLTAKTKIAVTMLLALSAAAAAGSLLLLRQRRQAANQLDRYAQRDQLTGLPNHRNFQRQVARQLAAPGSSEKQDCLLITEIADLDLIGQNYGLQAADSAITLTAGRLSELKPVSCEIAAIAHGRFGLYARRIGDAMDVLALAKDITAKLSQPLAWKDESIPLAVHSGIALSATDGANVEELLHSAELALRQAQEQGSQGYSFFNPSIARDARRRVAVQRAVTDAMAQGTFRLDFQPVYEFQRGQLSGFEALLRLHDPELGAVSPAEFIPIAEQSGQINRIGAWCMLEACQIAVQWPAHLVVAVNLSPAQFYSGTLISDVRQALDVSRLPPYRLEVEITEGTLLKESDLVLQQLGVLRDMGVSVALDDFGTGYSSLSYLWKFPFSKIKIDRSFVNALGQNQNARGILRTIIKLGHGLGLTVTAEGIETEAQFATLKELHCDLAQGFLLDRPSRVADLAAIILRNFANGLTRKTKSAAQTAKPVKTA